jgi:hypothetical protein
MGTRLTRRQRLFLRLAAFFLFALYVAVPPLREWVPLWLPLLALLAFEILLFCSGYPAAEAPFAPTKRLPGLEDADLLESGYRRALIRRELARRRVGPAEDEEDLASWEFLDEEDTELEADEEEWHAVLPYDEAETEPPFSGWRLGRLVVPAWSVEFAGLVFVALWLSLSGLRGVVPAVLALLLGALSLAGAVSGLVVSGVPTGVRRFSYRHPRVVQLAEVTAVLLGVTGIFLALVRPQGWDAVPAGKQARAERVFSQAASAIAGKPVLVRCDSDYVATGYTHDAAGVAVVGGTEALLDPDVCVDLARLALDGRVVSRERTSRALVVLAHEAWHLRGEASERSTECYALQSGVALGIRFGLSEKRAYDFMRYRLALNASDYRLDPAYVVGNDCRDGGDLDLHPRSHHFP